MKELNNLIHKVQNSYFEDQLLKESILRILYEHKVLKKLHEKKTERIPFTEIIKLWNGFFESYHVHEDCGIKPIKGIKGKRKTAFSGRWNDDSNNYCDLEFWRHFFTLVFSSDFLTFRNGAWDGCSFDWCIAPTNFCKILEGKYRNRGAKVSYYSPLTIDDVL